MTLWEVLQGVVDPIEISDVVADVAVVAAFLAADRKGVMAAETTDDASVAKAPSSSFFSANLGFPAKAASVRMFVAGH